MNVLRRKLDIEKTKSDYKNVAWFYDCWGWLTESKATKKILEWTETADKPTILEIACGTGVLFEKIVAKNPNGQNMGVDLSPDMLKRARIRMVKSNFRNYELKEGNVLELDFKDGAVDILINNYMVT